jgi:hypothetical protein
MYIELKADSQRAFKQALWDSELIGLDPEVLSLESLTFSVGTGNIEKVSRIRDKYNLSEIYESDSEPYHPYRSIDV